MSLTVVLIKLFSLAAELRRVSAGRVVFTTGGFYSSFAGKKKSSCPPLKWEPRCADWGGPATFTTAGHTPYGLHLILTLN